MSWAFQPLLPASNQLAKKTGDVTESASAIASQDVTVDYQVARTETTTATSQDVGSVDYPVSQTDTGTPTDSMAGVYDTPASLSESTTPSESATGIPQYGGILTESGTATDSEDRTYFGNAFSFEFSDNTPILPGIFTNNTNNNTYGNGTTLYGLSFTSNYSGQVGVVQANINQYLIGSTFPTTLGSVRIYNLTSKTDTTLGTLVAQLDINFTDLTYGSGTASQFDFSNVSGATLVSGNSYFVVLVPGTDWGVSTNYSALIHQYNANLYETSFYNTVNNNVAVTRSANMTGFGAGSTLSAASYYTAYAVYRKKANAEYYNGGFPQAVAITETGTPADAQSRTRIGLVYGLNKDSPLDVYAGKSYFIGNAVNGPSYGRGTRFKNTKADVLTTVGIPIYKVKVLDSAAITTTGMVEVWTLASNSLTGTPSTQFASISFADTDLPSPISSLTSITNNVIGSAGLTQYVSITTDDSAQSLTLPWTVNFLGKSYTTVYVGSNSYLTFGAGATTYNNLSAVDPNLPKIAIGTADNSYQQVFAGTEGTAPNRTYRVRYEGTNGTTGVVGSPNIVWEITFYENNTSQIDIQIGANARGAGSLYGIYTEDAQVGDLRSNIATTNVGYRMVSSTNNKDIVSKDNIKYFDFTSQNKVLVASTGYMVSVKAGSDWGSAKDYYGIYSVNALSPIGNTSGATVATAQTLEGYNAATVSGPIYANNLAWNTGSVADTLYYTFRVNNSINDMSADNQTYFTPISDSIAETVTADHTNDRTYRPEVYTIDYPADQPAFADGMFGRTGAAYSSTAAAGNIGRGMTFLAERTGVIGNVYIKALRYAITGTVPTSTATLEVWQLASNSITALPSTLLGTYNFTISELTGGGATTGTQAAGAFSVFDLSSLNITLTQGVGYFVGWKIPADWTSTTQQMTYAYYAATTPVGMENEYNYSYSKYRSLTAATFATAWTAGATSTTIYPFTITSATATADNYLGGFGYPVDDPETVTSTETQDRLVSADRSLTESGTTTEAQDRLVLATRDITETGATSESSSLTLNANAWISNEAFVGLEPPTSGSYSGYPISAGVAYGTSFIANKTGRIGHIGIRCYVPGSGTATTTGTIELWSLTGNTVTGVPNTMIASAPISTSEFSVTLGSSLISFKGAAADVTVGNAYAVVLRGGTDWSSGVAYPSLLQNASPTAADRYNSALVDVRGINYTGGSWYTNTSPAIPQIIEQHDETALGGYTVPKSITESATSSETIDKSIVAFRDLNETGSSADSIIRWADYYLTHTETGSATQSETTQLNAVASSTEAGSATVSDVGNYVTFQTRSESVTAGDDPTGQSLLYSSRTETLTITETFDGVNTIGGNASESGSANQTQTTQLTAYASLTETGTATVYDNGGFLTDQFMLETSLSASDSETSYISFDMYRPETLTASETITNLTTFTTNLTESVTSTTTQNDYLLAAVSVTEALVMFDEDIHAYLDTGFNDVIEPITLTDESFNVILFNRSEIADGSATDSQFNIATILANVTETRTVTDVQFNTADFYVTRTETSTASDSEFNSVLFDTSITEIETSTETQSNVVSFMSYRNETASANDDSINTFIAVTSVDETASVYDTLDNTASRVASLVEAAFATDLSEKHVIFVSYLYEALTTLGDSQSNIITADTRIEEIVSLLESQTNFANLLSQITEALYSAEDVRGDTGMYQDEALSLTDTSEPTIFWQKYISEYANPDEATSNLVVFSALMHEIGLAEETAVGWLLFALDYDILAAHSSTVEYEYDHIYMEDIEVVYGNAPSVEVKDSGGITFKYVA